MRKKIISIIMMLLIITTFNLYAEDLLLDCDKCIELALANNSGLLQQAISLGTARRNADASWNNFLPDVSVSLGLSGRFNITSAETLTSSALNPGLSISYNLSPGLGETIQQLRLSLENSEISYEAAVNRLREQVESEFYYLLTTEGNIDIQEKNIELAQLRLQQTETRFRSGLVPELDVLQARVNAANLAPAYTSLVSSYENRLKEFFLAIGIDPMSDAKLSGSLDVQPESFDAEQLIAVYLENRSDIRLQRKQIESLQSRLRQTKAVGHLPSVRLSASVSDSVSDPFTADGWQGWSEGLPTAGISLSLTASLGLDDYIPGSSTDIGIKQIEDSILQAELQLESLVENAKLEVINIVDSMEANRENLELSLLNLELSESTFEMTQKSFEIGKTDSLTLQNSQQDLLTANQNLLESRYDYLKGLITLRSALGLESLEDLEME